jgi:hypothetical protein
MQLKKTLTILILLVISFSSNAQSFEGTLTYKMDFELSKKMKSMGLTKKTMEKKLKNEDTWSDQITVTYKNGFYKQMNLSKNKIWIIHHPDSSKTYTFQEGELSDICFVQDVSKDMEFKQFGKMPSVNLLDTIVKYKKYNLKMVEVKWKMGSYYYLFDENYFQTNPDDFKDHIFDGFYEYLKLAKALPIKIIKGGGTPMTITQSLIKAEEKEIDKAIFNIPELVEPDGENGDLLNNMGLGKMMKIK